MLQWLACNFRIEYTNYKYCYVTFNNLAHFFVDIFLLLENSKMFYQNIELLVYDYNVYILLK